MECVECGSQFEGKRSGARFCGPECGKAWAMRRAMRGALFYDLIMANRFDRTEARAMKLTSAINRLASVYRDDDRIARKSRKSWRAPRDVLMDAPWLRTGEGRV